VLGDEIEVSIGVNDDRAMLQSRRGN